MIRSFASTAPLRAALPATSYYYACEVGTG